MVVVVVVVARRVVKRMHEKAKIIIEFLQVYRVQVQVDEFLQVYRVQVQVDEKTPVMDKIEKNRNSTKYK